MDLLLGILLGLFAMFAYGFAEIASTLAARKTAILRSNLWGWIVGSLLFFSIFVFVFHGSLPSFSTTQIVIVAAAGILSAFGYLAFYKGLRVGKASVIVPIADSSPIITVLLSFALLGENLSRIQVVGIALIILGTMVISARSAGSKDSAKRSYTAGINYALISVVCWGLMLFMIGFLIQTLGWFFPVFFAALVATVTNLLIAMATGARLAFPRSAGKPILVEAVLSAFGFLFYGLGVSASYVAVVAPISSASNFVTVIAAMALLKERPHPIYLVSIAILIMGIVALSI